MVCDRGSSSGNEILGKMEVMFSRRKPAIKESQFLKIAILVSKETGTEQIRHVLRASMAINAYAMKDSPIQKIFFHLFCDWCFFITLVNYAQLLQLVLDNSQE